MGRAPISFKKTSDPAITVDVEWRDRCFYFVLENAADAAMRDIRIAFRRKVIGMGGAVDIGALPLWQKLAFMPPHKRIEVTIDRDAVFFANNRTGPLGVSITYTDGEGQTWRAQISHDFEAYRGFPDLRIR